MDLVAFYDKPYLKFERLLETYHAFAPRGLRSFMSAIPVWIKEKLFMRRMLRDELAALGRAVPRFCSRSTTCPTRPAPTTPAPGTPPPS